MVSFHEANPKRASTLFFLAGVGFDAATIFRIDSLIDNAIILMYLGALCVLYIAATLHEAKKLENPFLLRFTRWYPIASQFLLGALFSMFVFFYSQSASLTETSLFLVALIGLLIANEVLHDRMFSARLRLSLLFFVLASYLVYFVPIATGAMNHLTFFTGLILAALTVAAIGRYLWRRGVFQSRDQMIRMGVTIPFLVGMLELFYVMNWIPPVPLAVRDAGIYHEVVRTGDTYRMRYAKPAWYEFLAKDERPFRYTSGDTAFAYTAIFAPTRIDKEILHVWEKRSADGDEWLETDRIRYSVSGGRDNGYRGYTQKRVIEPGQWRVRVETDDGRLLTRIGFDIVQAERPIDTWKWRTD